MRLRRLWLLALLAVLALGIAACGDQPGDEAEEGDGAEETEEEGAEGDAADEDEGEEGADTGDLELAEEGKILVGSDLDFAPFESIEDGEPVGFDVDLFDEIADRLGLEIEYQDANFDTIFTQLAAGEFDAIISAITITEEREQEISFTDPYFAANQALVVAADSDIASTDDLADMDVGAQAGTTGLDYANENFTESQIVEFDTYPAAFTALEAGQVDAVLADLPVAAEQEERSEQLEIAEEVDTDELYGIGVPQESDNLREAINEELAGIIEDGTYEEIYTEWFEGDVPEQFQN